MSTLLKGIKEIDDIFLSAIVTVADDGGSTGVLRKEFNLPAVGDLRKVILSLSSSDNEDLLQQIMNYRFQEKNTFLDNHSLGNIILTALIQIEKDFYLGIEKAKNLFNLKGEVIPVSSFNKIALKAFYTDNSTMIGESSIPNNNKTIDYIKYASKKIETNKLAIERIKNADFIIFSMGSLYTSLIANLIIPNIKSAIISNLKAKKIYVANVMTQNGETQNMSVLDHVNAIEKHLNKQLIDLVIVNNTPFDEKCLKKYAKVKSYPCEIDKDLEKQHFKVIKADILQEKSNYIHHDTYKIKRVFKQIIKSN